MLIIKLLFTRILVNLSLRFCDRFLLLSKSFCLHQSLQILLLLLNKLIKIAWILLIRFTEICWVDNNLRRHTGVHIFNLWNYILFVLLRRILCKICRKLFINRFSFILSICVYLVDNFGSLDLYSGLLLAFRGSKLPLIFLLFLLRCSVISSHVRVRSKILATLITSKFLFTFFIVFWFHL